MVKMVGSFEVKDWDHWKKSFDAHKEPREAAGIKTVTRNPARALNLLDRGALKEKLRADFCRVTEYKNTVKVRETYVKGQRVA